MTCETAPIGRHEGAPATTGLRYPFSEPLGPGAAVEVAPGILWVRMPLPMALDHVNIYALVDGDGWTLIDAGINSRASREALAALLAGPLGGRPVRRVIATHHHPDHIGLAGLLMAGHGAQLWTTRTAWLYARMLQLDHWDRPSPEAVAFARRAGYSPARLAAFEAAEPFNFSRTVAPLPIGFRRIEAGDEIEIGGRIWRVEIGHGHAPEHALLYCAEDDILLAGDQLLPRISSNLGVYPTEPDADPVTEWIDACRRLQELVTEATLVLPGHNEPFTGAPLRLRQLIENHCGALDRLRAHLATPRTAVECFPVLFKRAIGDAEFGLATVEAVAHLNCLQQRGEAGHSLDAEGAWRYRRLNSGSTTCPDS